MNISFLVQLFKLLGQLNGHVDDADLGKVTISIFENVLETVAKFLLDNIRLLFESA